MHDDYQFEYRIISKDGTEKTLLSNQPLITKDDNQVIRMDEVIRQSTAYIEYEQKVIETESMLNAITDAIVSTDINRNIISINIGFKEMFGYSREEVVMKPSSLLYESEEVHQHHAQNRLNLPNEYILDSKDRLKVNYRRKNGEIFIGETIRKVIKNTSGETIGFFSVIQDISEIMKSELRFRDIEEQLQKNRELENIGILIGGLAHDFNNVLTGIFGNLSLVKINLTDLHPGLKYVEKAENAMDRATRITGQLLTFSKGGTPVKKAVELTQLIEHTSLFELAGFNIKPVFDFPKTETIAHIDKNQIRQLIANIVLNAAQSMQEGGNLTISLSQIELATDAVATLEKGHYAKVEICDEGMGMDKKSLARVFHPYYSNKEHGSGLGLTTAYAILEKHKGYISIASEVGSGTTVSIYLPAQKPQKPQKEEKVSSAQMQEHQEQQRKVLVMDDDEMILTLLTSMLKLKNFSVDTVKNGESAIEKYQASLNAGKAYDVIIMDLTIPIGMGGMDAVKELIQIDSDVKCIVSSGYADDPIMTNYQDYGFKGVISKPFAVAELMDTLGKVLNK